jgi:phage gp45-like
MINTIKKVTEPLARRVALMVSKCSLTLIDDSTKTQKAQSEFFTGEVYDDSEVWQNFGFTSVAPSGSEGVSLFVGGERKVPLIIATECKGKRLNNLKEGDAAVYSLAGNYLKVGANNSVEIKTNKLSIKNDKAELIDLISQLLDQLSKAKTNTLIGAQPLINFNEFIKLKQKIDSFKE